MRPTPSLIGVEPEIRQAITNLILNAADALYSSGGIAIRTFIDENEVVLDVEDTGIGMTEEVRRQCLEPFFSTKGEKGTGLGLAMVYGIMQRHEGTIDIKSKPGKGSTFSLRLPITSVPEEIHGAEEVERPIPPKHILAVDDQPQVLELVSEYLVGEGIRWRRPRTGVKG